MIRNIKISLTIVAYLALEAARLLVEAVRGEKA